MRRLRHLAGLLRSLLKELADENAYERHLAAHGRTHSPEEWRRFSDERLGARFTRPKCC
ncbi:MAG: YbdD/YjiX family protein [Acidobacteria bacterium]|nr:YbdD/YjiX family protein [Acidobacteriota bacterium]